MKQINLFHKYSNPRIKILIKEKSNNKFQFISVLNGKKKNSFSLYNSNSINKNNFNFNKKNNITINNSINHIINNITINNNSLNGSKNNCQLKHNNSLSKQKEKYFNSYMDKKSYKDDISFKRPLNISRNGHNSFINNSNQSLYYLSLKNKIKKNPSFQNNKKNKLMNYKLKLSLKIPNNNNLNLQNINNNICSKNKTNSNLLYNFTNNSINENVKRHRSNNSKGSANQSTNLNKYSFYKKKSFNKKENKNIIKKNFNNNSIYKSNVANNNNNKLHLNRNNNNKLYDDYIMNKIFLKKNKTKNISINLKKFVNSGNHNNSLSNNLNYNHSNTNSNVQINKYVNNFLDKSKQISLNKIDEHFKNKIYISNYDIDEAENNKFINAGEIKEENKEENIEEKKEEKKIIINQEKIKEQSTQNKESSLDETIKFSKCSSKVEEEGELGLDEVKDIIVYYNLNNEMRSKNYMFKKNDYHDFIEKGKYKYLSFFRK